MKKIVALLIVSIVFAFTGQAMAAGSCVPLSVTREIIYRGLDKPYAFNYICTSDASDASVTPYTIPNLGGFLSAVEIDFGSAAPTSVALSVSSVLGNEIFPSGTLTASDYIPTDQPLPFAGGLTLTPTVVGNSKTFTVTLYVF